MDYLILDGVVHPMSIEIKVEPTIKLMRMLRALDNPIRLQIVQYIINSSPVSFTTILEHLQEMRGKTTSKGTLAYHLDLLLKGGVLSKELERGDDREYSKYNVTTEALKTLEELELLEYSGQT